MATIIEIFKNKFEKQEWDTTTHVFRMAKIYTDNIMLVSIWIYRNSHSLLVRMQNGISALEDSLADFYNDKQSCHMIQ